MSFLLFNSESTLKTSTWIHCLNTAYLMRKLIPVTCTLKVGCLLWVSNIIHGKGTFSWIYRQCVSGQGGTALVRAMRCTWRWFPRGMGNMSNQGCGLELCACPWVGCFERARLCHPSWHQQKLRILYLHNWLRKAYFWTNDPTPVWVKVYRLKWNE